jgi:hypothetical protein
MDSLLLVSGIPEFRSHGRIIINEGGLSNEKIAM